MVYPYWTEKDDLRKFLIYKKIYLAQYWPNVLEWCCTVDIETDLTNNGVHIPIDHRYNITDLSIISQIIINY